MRILSCGLQYAPINPIEFLCHVCYCRFIADDCEYKYDGDCNWYTIKCPGCGAELHEWRQN